MVGGANSFRWCEQLQHRDRLCHQKQCKVKVSNLIFCFHQTRTIPPSLVKSLTGTPFGKPFGKSVERKKLWTIIPFKGIWSGFAVNLHQPRARPQAPCPCSHPGRPKPHATRNKHIVLNFKPPKLCSAPARLINSKWQLWIHKKNYLINKRPTSSSK